PLSLVGDPNRLRQVLVNLLSNAIKFTDKGEVVLEVRADNSTALPPNQCRVHVAVRDTGIGIPAEKLEAIFDRFAQVDASITRKWGGTGLGLPISKRRVALMGGSLEVESGVGYGSTFHFAARFGLQHDVRAPRHSAPTTGLQGLRTLVVDDNATNRFIV